MIEYLYFVIADKYRHVYETIKHTIKNNNSNTNLSLVELAMVVFCVSIVLYALCVMTWPNRPFHYWNINKPVFHHLAVIVYIHTAASDVLTWIDQYLFCH